ncbi:MAG TPA: DUF2490 domain-containing protein [Flavobacterium sp.]|nr:DUF2490 domain-containing protein [Flavobacterium sp.]
MFRKVALIFLVITSKSFAQKTVQDQSVWFAYTGQYKASEKWGYHIEAQFRLDNELEQNLQNLYRIGGIYYLSKNQSLTAGLSLIKTYSVSTDAFFTENRIWQQYQLNTKWNSEKNTITHRVRLEERWVDQITLIDDEVKKLATNYQSRVRYLNRNLFHLYNFKSTNEELYAVVQNEVFFNIGNNKVNSKFFDQNRFLVGLGLNYNNNIRIELGYLNHYITSSSAQNLMRHTVSVSLIQNLVL